MPKARKTSRPAPKKPELSQTMRDYLKSAYRLSVGDTQLTITRLAKAKKVAPASVTAMVKKLTRAGLMTHQHYGSISLTEAGSRQALLAIRRHRLVECFLVRMLHFRLDEVHEESHRLEPVISDAFEMKIDKAMGHPKRCPHGDPIPDINGVLKHVPGFPLTELQEGVSAMVCRVPGSKKDLLRYLLDLGIEPEKPICVLRRDPFGGPLHLKLGRRTVLIGPEAARGVFVTDSVS